MEELFVMDQQGSARGNMLANVFEVLLEDPAWQAAERTLRREDLQSAQALVVCNALRGALLAQLQPEPHAASAA